MIEEYIKKYIYKMDKDLIILSDQKYELTKDNYLSELKIIALKKEQSKLKDKLKLLFFDI